MKRPLLASCKVLVNWLKFDVRQVISSSDNHMLRPLLITGKIACLIRVLLSIKGS